MRRWWNDNIVTIMTVFLVLAFLTLVVSLGSMTRER